MAASLPDRLVAEEEQADHRVVVSGNESGEEFEEPGGYGQPQWAERSRASATTKLYVLSPFEFFAGLLSESDFLRGGGLVHDFAQEIELGLPHRFELDLENHIGFTHNRTGETELNFAARYALADWGKLALNPTLSVGYHFGLGERVGERFHNRGKTDSCELRLLFGQEFIPRWQWAANIFFEHDFGSHRQVGFTQDLAYLAIADKLELGVEMRYTNATRQNKTTANDFIIGPSVNWKPNLHTVLSLAPLFGCTADSPRVAMLASVSLEFGGGESKTVRPREPTTR